MSKLEYNIISEIKKSKKGNVYLASVDSQPFPVIVKELKYGDINVYESLKDIKNEHLPEILYVEQLGDGLLVVEEYVEGELLSEYIDKSKLNEEDCFNIAKQLCLALKELHNHIPPLIHRDIKPSNIIISPSGFVRLIDFDSSRLYKDESESDTRFLGTESYAPPEQYGFSQTDCRSDIYSLGVVLGKFTEYISSGKRKEWKQMVEKCTSFSPENRYKNADEIIIKLTMIKKRGVILICKLGMMVAIIIGVILLGDFLWDMTSDENSPEKEMLAQEKATEELTIGISASEKNTTETNISETVTTEEITTEINTTQSDEKTTEETIEEDTTIEEVTTTSPPKVEYTPVEEYYCTPPEWRDIESEHKAYVTVKKNIRQNNAGVFYHFKDRTPGGDFYYQIKELEYTSYRVKEMKLRAINGNKIDAIDGHYEVKDNLISIDRTYMDSLEEGYYSLEALIGMPDGGEYRYTNYLYVASSDALQEQGCWMQNTTFDYNGEAKEIIHIVLKNESLKSFDSIRTLDGEEMYTGMYKILYGGRVIEITKEFFDAHKDEKDTHFLAVATDGSAFCIDVYKK